MNQHVSIQPATVADAEEMIAAMNPADLKNFSMMEEPVTVERERKYLQAAIDNPAEAIFAILCRGRIIGTCGLHEIDRNNHNARLGVMIFSNEFRGQSIGSAGIRQLLAFAYRNLMLYKVYLNVFADNRQSCIKFLHLGFQLEARLEKHYFLRGVYHDMVRLRLFRDEWDHLL